MVTAKSSPASFLKISMACLMSIASFFAESFTDLSSVADAFGDGAFGNVRGSIAFQSGDQRLGHGMARIVSGLRFQQPGHTSCRCLVRSRAGFDIHAGLLAASEELQLGLSFGQGRSRGFHFGTLIEQLALWNR